MLPNQGIHGLLTNQVKDDPSSRHLRVIGQFALVGPTEQWGFNLNGASHLRNARLARHGVGGFGCVGQVLGRGKVPLLYLLDDRNFELLYELPTCNIFRLFMASFNLLNRLSSFSERKPLQTKWNF